MRRSLLLPALVMLFALGMFTAAYAWTHNEHFHNGTGQTINDVHKVLDGEYVVTEMMTVTFPNTDWAVVQTPGGFQTILDWWGAEVPHCEYAHVCFTVTDMAGNAAYGAQIKRAYFTWNGAYVGDLGATLSAEGRAEGDVFMLAVGNFRELEDGTPAPPVFIEGMDVAFVDSCLQIEDLVFENLYDPASPLAWQEVAQDLWITEHGMWVPLWQEGMPPGSAAAVLRATLYDDTDPEPYHDFMQFTLQPGGPSATEETSWSKVKALYR